MEQSSAVGFEGVISPLTQSTDGLQSQLDAAEKCLEQERFQNCYEFIAGAIARADGLDADDIECLDSLLSWFQEALFDTGAYGSIGKWFCPDQQGLLRKLTAYLRRHDDHRLVKMVLKLLWAGIDHLDEAQGVEALQLKHDYLQEACKLTTSQGLEEEAQKLIHLLGCTYLRLAELLPSEKCFDRGYLRACLCFNIAQDEKQLREVEKGYLGKTVENFDHMPSWAERYIWDRKTPEAVLYVVELAERLIDYGQQETACSLYAKADTYGLKYPFEQSKAIHARYLEIANPITAPARQDNRKLLHAIRQLTTYLFESGKGQQPTIPSHFTSTVERCLKELHLPTDLEKVMDQGLSIHQIQRLHGALMIAFAEDLYLQAVHLMGPPPCDYCLVGLGSLARGEMNIHSDLDAIVLVEKSSKQVTSYFQRVACYFELMVTTLARRPQQVFSASTPSGTASALTQQLFIPVR